MARRAGFTCTACASPLPQWSGTCPRCKAQDSVVESIAAVPLPGLRTVATGTVPLRPARPLAEVSAERTPRMVTGLGEFDRVLGGGLVAGQVVLLAGEPGVGKSTLLAAVADRAARLHPGRVVLYVSGEESVEQISVRARRIGAEAPGILLADETDLSAVLGHVEAHDPVLLIVDSVQSLASGAVEGRAGGMSQVQEVAAVLTRVAKGRRMPLLLVGQSTKESAIAGPRTLEHLVDTVLTFEGDRRTSLRLLRAVKNRYGPADEVVCFEQSDEGLVEVPDPSDLFRSHRDSPVAGTAVAVAVDGRRAIPAEVQALVGSETVPGTPRRGVSGLESTRVAMLLAVTGEHAQLQVANKDVFVATVGGARLADPATDLAVCLALASAAWGIPMTPDVAAIGEVALSGDIRGVSMISQRVAEAVRLGYRTVMVPPGSTQRLGTLPAGTRISELPHLSSALQRLQALKKP